MTHESLLVAKQIAAELGYSTKTIYRKFEKDELPGAFQVGGKGGQIKISESDLNKLKGRE